MGDKEKHNHENDQALQSWNDLAKCSVYFPFNNFHVEHLAILDITQKLELYLKNISRGIDHSTPQYQTFQWNISRNIDLLLKCILTCQSMTWTGWYVNIHAGRGGGGGGGGDIKLNRNHLRGATNLLIDIRRVTNDEEANIILRSFWLNLGVVDREWVLCMHHQISLPLYES